MPSGIFPEKYERFHYERHLADAIFPILSKGVAPSERCADGDRVLVKGILVTTSVVARTAVGKIL